jgi:hypothetical protein
VFLNLADESSDGVAPALTHTTGLTVAKTT